MSNQPTKLTPGTYEFWSKDQGFMLELIVDDKGVHVHTRAPRIGDSLYVTESTGRYSSRYTATRIKRS